MEYSIWNKDGAGWGARKRRLRAELLGRYFGQLGELRWELEACKPLQEPRKDRGQPGTQVRSA